jgi:hypothetical protein
VLQGDAANASKANVFQDVLDGHFATEAASIEAAYQAA